MDYFYWKTSNQNEYYLYMKIYSKLYTYSDVLQQQYSTVVLRGQYM